jgi:7,8-dihydroneopterin aldolase/epimerase/oxygenase
MSTVVFRIDGVAAFARHGVHRAERELGQRFTLDLVLTIDPGRALESDRYEDSVCYGDMTETALRAFTARDFNLIETAAAAVGDALLARFPRLLEAAVTVHKPSAPVAAILADISATVVRGRAA